MIDFTEWMTINEAAGTLHRSVKQIRRYIHAGTLEARLIGRQYFIRKSSVQAMSTHVQAQATGRERPDISERIADLQQEVDHLWDHLTIITAERFKRLEQSIEDIRSIVDSSNQVLPATRPFLPPFLQETSNDTIFTSKAPPRSNLAKKQGISTPGTNRTKTGKTVSAKETLPANYVSAPAFAELHGISRRALRTAIEAREGFTIEGIWKLPHGYVKHVFDASGMSAFYLHFHERENFVRCPECPHDTN